MQRKVGICKFRGETKELIKAHVISRTLFKAIFLEYGRVHQISVQDLDGRNLVQDAFYDYSILCGPCDRSFGPYEDYFSTFILGGRNKKRIPPKDKFTYAHYGIDVYDNIDHHKLRMFFMITLWRCSISELTDFKAVDLGVYEDVVKEQIKTCRLGSYDVFATTLISLEDVDDVRTETVFTPMRSIWVVPVIMIVIKGWAIIYNFSMDQMPHIFDHRLLDNDQFSVMRLNQELGLILLQKITGLEGNVKKGSIEQKP